MKMRRRKFRQFAAQARGMLLDFRTGRDKSASARTCARQASRSASKNPCHLAPFIARSYTGNLLPLPWQKYRSLLARPLRPSSRFRTRNGIIRIGRIAAKLESSSQYTIRAIFQARGESSSNIRVG